MGIASIGSKHWFSVPFSTIGMNAVYDDGTHTKVSASGRCLFLKSTVSHRISRRKSPDLFQIRVSKSRLRVAVPSMDNARCLFCPVSFLVVATHCCFQVFPLPVEGAETKVLADDQEVSNYMIDLGDLLETVSSGNVG